jgi:outer membrane protein assembly factor BamB
VLVALAGLTAALFFGLRESTPADSLETTLADVTVIPPEPPPTPKPTAPTPKPRPKPKPKPPPAAPVDRRCWKMFGGGPTRSLARLEIHLGIPKRPPLWARGLKGYVEYPPSYCDGMLYVNTTRGDTWAIHADSGKVLWRRKSRARKPSTPAIAGPYVIVAAKDGTVTALDRRNGRRVWQVRTGAIVESSPAVEKGVVYFGNTRGRLFAVSARNGRIRWVYNTGGRINSSPALANGHVFVTTYAGSIFSLRARDGRKRWRTYVRRDFLRRESFYASPSTDGARVYTIARSGRVVTLSARTGKVLWSRRVNTLGYSTPAIGRDRIFVGDFKGQLRAYRKLGGKEIWRARVGRGRILGAPFVVGNLVFFATLEQKAYAARVSDGRIVWTISIGKYSPGIATERAYYFTLNGILVAFRGRYSPE